MEKYKLDCKAFTGYKPCSPGKVCAGCADYTPMGTRILIINLDAMGDVMRTTALLHPVKRKYKESHITWLTDTASVPLLANNPYVDRALEYSAENSMALLTERFDVLMNVDKSRRSGALANLIDAKEKLGFGIAETGAIYPFNKDAEHLYEIGLNDELKFRQNQKNEQELLAEAMGFEYKRDEYVLELTEDEKAFVEEYKKEIGLRDNQIVIGFNTGCSNAFPYKKLAFDSQILLLKRLNKLFPHDKIILLGGREDTENNLALKKRMLNKVTSTPTDQGLRKGILYMAPCDIVLTGDSLGLHLAIGLKKKVVSWFTLTCAEEIDLYDRGHKLLADIECRPCWKRECAVEPKCNTKVDIERICESVKELREGAEVKA